MKCGVLDNLQPQQPRSGLNNNEVIEKQKQKEREKEKQKESLYQTQQSKQSPPGLIFKKPETKTASGRKEKLFALPE